MAYRTIAGAGGVYVEAHGVRSETVALTAEDGPAEIHETAARLRESIRPLVSWLVWARHRRTMANQRRVASLVTAHWPGPYYLGPRPDLIAVRPWERAAQREWASLPPGAVARLLRG